jgi:hypothetical protein
MDNSAGIHPDVAAARRQAVEEIDLELLHGCRRLTTRNRTGADMRHGEYSPRDVPGIGPA